MFNYFNLVIDKNFEKNFVEGNCYKLNFSEFIEAFLNGNVFEICVFIFAIIIIYFCVFFIEFVLGVGCYIYKWLMIK